MTEPDQRLRAIVVARVLAALDAMSGAVSLSSLEAMVASRDLTALYRDVDRTYASIAEIAVAAFLLSLSDAAPRAHPMLVANTSTWRVANDQAVIRHGLATTLADDQKRLLSSILRDSRGMSDRLIAVRLHNALGLTAPLMEGVSRYEQVAGMTSRAEVERKQLVTPDQVATMTRAQAANYRRIRADAIGTTEAQRAHGRADLEAWRQASEQGLRDRARVTRIWNVTHHNTRDSHLAMDQQPRGLDEPFQSGLGNHLMHPCDWTAPVADVANCQCWVTYGLRP